jgi:hypothetical protein
MMTPWLVVSVHDVAPPTKSATEDWLAELDDLGVTSTLLVVPGPWRSPALSEDRAFGAWLRAAGLGHEIAQHGWAHRATGEGSVARRLVGSVMARGCAEFLSLDESEARRRLEWGRDVLRAAGTFPQGCVAPGWLASAPSVRAMAGLGYRYTTTHTAVIDLASGRRHRAPALSHRPGGSLERAGARLIVTAARALCERRRPLRIALHPDDLHSPALVAATRAAIETALDAAYDARAYIDVVGSPIEARK